MTRIALFTLVALAPTFARADFDVRPFVQNGQIMTGGHDDGTGEDIPATHAFGYAFGEDPNDPYFTQDPGFNAEAGSGLPPGSQLTFNILSNLKYWNGTGSPMFSATPSTESLEFNFGAQTRYVFSTSAAQAGFALQTVTSDGASHRHLNAFLNASDGNSDASDGVVAPDGVYAVRLQLASSNASTRASDPFYVVYGSGVSDDAVDAAVTFLNASSVPEPATLATLALAAVALRRRRR